MAVYSNFESDTKNYLEGCQPNVSVIPGYAALDEMAFHVVEASEIDFNKMMIECGVEELYHLEESKTEMVYEEGKVTELKNKAVEFFKKMWENVQGLIKKAIDTFQKKSREVREKLLNKIDKNFLSKRVDNIPANKDFGVGYGYSNITLFSAKVRAKITNADNKVDKIREEMTENQKNGNNTTDGYENRLKEIVDTCVKEILPDHNISSPSGVKKVMVDAIRGSRFQANGTWVKSNYTAIFKEVVDYPETKSNLKKDYKELQKSFNEAIKQCKKIDNSKMFEASAFTKAIKTYKSLRQIAVYSQQAIISCLNERYSFYRGILFKLIGVKKAANDKAVGESTTVDSISSLFDWD